MAGARATVTRNELTRKTQFIRRTMREESLADLLDANEVVVRAQADRFSHGERLYLADLAPQK